MQIKNELFKEFIKNGYANADGSKVWNIAQRRFLYITPDLAKAFLDLRKVDFYRKQVIDREIALLQAHAPKIAKLIGKDSFNLVDVFCGDGQKAVEFLRVLQPKGNVRYCSANVSEYLINLAVKNVKKEKFSMVSDFKPTICDCHGTNLSELITKLRNHKYQKNVILNFGSVLASYEINDYLFSLSRRMFQGDVLIIGNSIRKGERLENLDIYKKSVWNDWFKHLMKGIDFKPNEVEYNARFGNSRIEMYYKLKTDKNVKHKGKTVNFKSNDEVLVAILYKYYPEELKKFCQMYFSNVTLVKDKDNEYALVLCVK